jgi:AraC-like DNA-binding protein
MAVRWYFWSTGTRLRVIEMLEEHTLPPLEFQIVGSLMLLTFVSYLFLGFRRIILYNKHIRDMASFTDTLHLRWLSFLAGVMLLPIVSAVASLLATGSPRIAPYVAGAISVMIGIIGLAAWIKPAILNGIPPRLMLEQAEDLEPPRYSSSSLSPEQKERYLTQITAHMETRRPWLNQEFTLSDLSEQLDINAKYLSQVINERLEQNFMEFVNGYRIRYAQELLLHPAYQHYTVQAIGHEVGFRSRSAFYDAFREATGRTPAAWRGQAQSATLS